MSTLDQLLGGMSAKDAARVRASMRKVADDIKKDAKRRPGSFFFQPTEFAPAYAELNPNGSTEIVHVITTLEA